MTSKEKFADDALINVAKRYFKAGCYDGNAIKVLNNASVPLNTIERNLLLRFVEQYQDVMFDNIRSGMSMRQMRDGLLRKAGREDLIDSGYAANVSSRQLRAIYNFVMGIEDLKED